MPGKSVAGEGEVVATPGSTPFTGAETGVWTAGPIAVQSYSKLTTGGKPVIHQAQCTFNFNGQSSSGASVVGAETVTLMAGQTLLQKTQGGVLVNGDTASGQFGNKLEVKTTNVLHSA